MIQSSAMPRVGPSREMDDVVARVAAAAFGRQRNQVAPALLSRPVLIFVNDAAAQRK
jgi:hypothetical protein